MSADRLREADRLITGLCEARGADEYLPLAERLAALSRAELDGKASGDDLALSVIRRTLFDDPQPTTGATGPARQELPGAGGLLHRGHACLLFSDRGEGKSIVAVITALSVAQAGVPIYYFDRENGAAVTYERAEAILDANDWPDVLAEGHFVGRHYPRLSRDWEPEDYGEAIVGRGFGLVIYDSLREAISQLGGDPNSDADISRFVDLAVTPLVRRDAAVLILDNTGHEAKNRPKGSGSKLDAIPQAYRVKTTDPFSSLATGRVELTCIRSRFGDVGRKWTARIGGGVYELPVARDEAPDAKAARERSERREAFCHACIEALREQGPRGRDDLIVAARDRGGKGRSDRLRAWLADLAADPTSGLTAGPDGYSLTPDPDEMGQGGVTPPEAPLTPTPLSLKGGGQGPGPDPDPAGHPRDRGVDADQLEGERRGLAVAQSLVDAGEAEWVDETICRASGCDRPARGLDGFCVRCSRERERDGRWHTPPMTS